MAECFRCGASGTDVILYNTISKEGLVKVCGDCYASEDISLGKRSQFIEPSVKLGVYERLSRLAGLNPQEHRAKFLPARLEREERIRKQETNLKEIIDRNYQKNLPKNPVPREDLIPNFHWIIMRARRMKKLTQEQLALAIGETETAIKMAEQGIISFDNDLLIGRLENFLGIRIRQKDYEEEKPKVLDLSKASSKELTIADLKEMRALNESLAEKQEFDDESLLNEEFKRKLEQAFGNKE